MTRRFQNILHVTRGVDDEIESARQALGLARHESAALHTLIVGPELPKDLAYLDASYRESLKQRAGASLASAGAALRMSPEAVDATSELELGKPQAERIVRRVLREAHDLVIKQAGAGEHAEEFRALDIELLRLCPCPVWLSRPIPREPAKIRVGVAVDPQSRHPADLDLARQSLQLSRMLADALSGELHILSAWSYELEESLRLSPWVKIPDDIIHSAVGAADRDHHKALDARIQDAGIGGPMRIRRERGNPAQVIPNLVDEMQIDILVMGTMARSGIPGYIIGNTAEQVLRQVRCSLVAMKPNGFTSPVRAY